ncbi:hypothetical protein BDZ89DRAFT_1045653 [Hymenopellis radicata]|nr:hypothetical protein BDZ89DRAFT_1045653 [Hymenopellis radicata]
MGVKILWGIIVPVECDHPHPRQAQASSSSSSAGILVLVKREHPHPRQAQSSIRKSGPAIKETQANYRAYGCLRTSTKQQCNYLRMPMLSRDRIVYPYTHVCGVREVIVVVVVLALVHTTSAGIVVLVPVVLVSSPRPHAGVVVSSRAGVVVSSPWRRDLVAAVVGLDRRSGSAWLWHSCGVPIVIGAGVGGVFLEGVVVVVLERVGLMAPDWCHQRRPLAEMNVGTRRNQGEKGVLRKFSGGFKRGRLRDDDTTSQPWAHKALLKVGLALHGPTLGYHVVVVVALNITNLILSLSARGIKMKMRTHRAVLPDCRRDSSHSPSPRSSGANPDFSGLWCCVALTT